MNLTNLKKTGATTLTTSRECHLAGNPKTRHLAANPKPGREDWYHPRTSDPTLIIPSGTTLQVLAVQPSIPGRQMAGVQVATGDGRTFLILPTDLPKLTL